MTSTESCRLGQTNVVADRPSGRRHKVFVATMKGRCHRERACQLASLSNASDCAEPLLIVYNATPRAGETDRHNEK